MAQPMSLPQSLSAHLTPLQLRLRDINAYQLPRLTSSSSSNAPSSLTPETLSSYENELNEALAECSSLIEEGDWVVSDIIQGGQADDEVESLVTVEWDRVKAGYSSARIASRSALLAARKALAERKKAGVSAKAHDDNGAPHSTIGPHKSVRQQHKQSRDRKTNNNYTGDDAALLASSELTSSLQNALGLLSDSLSQSTLSTTLLEESTSTLSTLSLSYTSFTDLLKNSSGILKSMESQDRWDALMLLAAYLFFVVCVGYILKVRIWDRGLKVLMILLRLGGIRSKEDIKEKMVLAKEAAKSDVAKKVASAVVTTATTGLAAVVGVPPVQTPQVVEFAEQPAVVGTQEQENILDQVQDILEQQQQGHAGEPIGETIQDHIEPEVGTGDTLVDEPDLLEQPHEDEDVRILPVEYEEEDEPPHLAHQQTPDRHDEDEDDEGGEDEDATHPPTPHPHDEL